MFKLTLTNKLLGIYVRNRVKLSNACSTAGNVSWQSVIRNEYFGVVAIWRNVYRNDTIAKQNTVGRCQISSRIETVLEKRPSSIEKATFLTAAIVIICKK